MCTYQNDEKSLSSIIPPFFIKCGYFTTKLPNQLSDFITTLLPNIAALFPNLTAKFPKIFTFFVYISST